MENVFELKTYDYHLPAELIANKLEKSREGARMMIIDCQKRFFSLERHFSDLTDCLDDNYVVVLNNTKVFPALIELVKKGSGGKWEMLFLGEAEKGIWKVITPKAKRVRLGDVFLVANANLELEVVRTGEEGLRYLRVGIEEKKWKELLWQYGKMPLPPYVKKDLGVDYRQEYQTVFARKEGSVAAPTAGFHFSEKLIEALRKKGVIFEEITLHVGLGTFLPVKSEDIRRHKIHQEQVEYDRESWARLIKYKKEGKKILAVGTTAVRYMESMSKGMVLPEKSWTDLFIYPGYKFDFVDEMITNFHLPKSTLLMLVAAFICDRGDFSRPEGAVDFLLAAYKAAVEKKWKFFSFGDGMWVR